MSYRILVPLDGSVLADRAIPWADHLAGALHAEVELVRVVSDGATATADQPHRDVGRELQPFDVARGDLATASPWFLRARAVRRAVLQGEPAPTIARHAVEIGADLIVMTTHGQGGLPSTRVGSVAERVVREARLPVMAIRAEIAKAPLHAPQRVVISLNRSQHAERVLPIVSRLAQELHWSVTLLGVASPPAHAKDSPGDHSLDASTVTEERARLMAYLEYISAQLQALGIPTVLATRFGDPGRAIVDFVREGHFDLVGMSTQGLHIGSVTRYVLCNASAPLLALHPPSLCNVKA